MGVTYYLAYIDSRQDQALADLTKKPPKKPLWPLYWLMIHKTKGLL